MPTWIIEPRDPLIVRDGRPFGPDPGVRATSLEFPFPSTIAGGARGRHGLNEERLFARTITNIEQVLGLQVHGPLLVELTTPNGKEELAWYGPAPADALLSDDGDRLRVLALRPSELPVGSSSNGPADLLPLGAAERFPAKLSSRAPRFWCWKHLVKWLLQREAAPWLDAGATVAPDDIGVGGLPRDRRMHVSIESDQKTALDGALFQTSGLSFTLPGRRRFGLALHTSADFPHFADGGLAPLAGERRVVAWRKWDASLPGCPPTLAAQLGVDKACRVMLVTPAVFDAGYRPAPAGPLLRGTDEVSVTLRAAALPRPQVVSGWDFASNNFAGGPKPTRRLAPAGAVYYLSLNGAPEAIEAWVSERWMRPVSDQERDGADGFGLAVFGTWPSAAQALKGASDAAR